MPDTIYILVGSDRTDSTTDPKKVVGMRAGCGETGVIYVWAWQASLNPKGYPEPYLLDTAEWPQTTPDFSKYGLNSRAIAL